MKKMKNKTKILLPVILVASFFFFGQVSAKTQEIKPLTQADLEKIMSEIGPTLQSKAGIREPKIISQQNNKITVNFKIISEDTIQPGIKYAVSLMQGELAGRHEVDRKVYDDVVTVYPAQPINKEIAYEAPSFLNGTYDVQITIATSDGNRIAGVSAGQVTLSGSGEYIETTLNKCSLFVKGEDATKKFMLLQGIDIKSDESLILHCTFKNNFKKDISAYPSFSTFYRSIFGNKISSDKGAVIQMKSGEQKEIDIPILAVSNPQAYDVEINLLDAQGNLVSNNILAHYVLKGLSATIQNILLNKDFYVSGDTASVKYFVTGPADTFPNSRYAATELNGGKIEILLKNGQGEMCADSFVSTLAFEKGSVSDEANLAITKECQDPTVSVSIKDQTGTVLAARQYSVKSINIPANVDNNKPIDQKTTKSSYGFIFLLILLLILFVAVGMFILLRKKKNAGVDKIKLVLFFLFFTGATIPGICKADCITLVPGISSCTDKTSYSPGESIELYYNLPATVWGPNCGNSPTVYFAFISNGVYNSTNSAYLSGGSSLVSSYGGAYLYEQAPFTPGSYNLSVSAYSMIQSNYFVSGFEFLNHQYDGIIPFTVTCASTGCAAANTICSGQAYVDNCGNSCGTGTKTSLQPIPNLSANLTTITSGDPVTLSWNPINAVSCALNNVVKYNTTLRSEIVYPTINPTVYKLKCFNSYECGDPPSATETVSITVNSAAPPPPTLEFTSIPSTNPSNPIGYNTAATLSWTAQNATGCWGYSEIGKTWPGGDNYQAISDNVSTGNLIANQTYNMDCWNSADVHVTKSVTVNVVAAPPIPNPTLTLASTPTNPIGYNTAATLSWTAQNATGCWGYSEIGKTWPGGDYYQAFSDNVSTGNLIANQTYNMECWNSADVHVVKSVTVNVAAAPISSLTLSSNPLSPINYNTATNLTWTTQNVDWCYGDPWPTVDWKSSEAGSYSETTVNLTAAATYTMKCGNSVTGQQVTQSISIDVNPCVPNYYGYSCTLNSTGTVCDSTNCNTTITTAVPVCNRADYNNCLGNPLPSNAECLSLGGVTCPADQTQFCTCLSLGEWKEVAP